MTLTQNNDVAEVIAAEDLSLDEQLLDACEKGSSYEEVMKIIENGGNYKTKTFDNWTVLHKASRNGHKDLVQAFIELEPELVKETTNLGQTALHLASQGGYHDIVEILMECNAEVDARDNFDITPLHLASKYGHIKVATTLVQFGFADFGKLD